VKAKLYKAVILIETVVKAENEDQAIGVLYSQAEKVFDAEFRKDCIKIVGEVANKESLPDGWQGIEIPWGSEGNAIIKDILWETENNPPLPEEDIELLREYALHLKKENERLQKELSLLLLSQITENDQKLGLYE